MRLALLLSIAALALGGCKSTSQTDAATVRDDGVDRDRMAQVEKAAERNGTKVQWVNPPLKATK